MATDTHHHSNGPWDPGRKQGIMEPNDCYQTRTGATVIGSFLSTGHGLVPRNTPPLFFFLMTLFAVVYKCPDRPEECEKVTKEQATNRWNFSCPKLQNL